MGNVKIIGASAGSGKTYRLAYEYVKSVVENPMLYRHILAVTFTNKATEEMRSRILARLHELASGEHSPYLEDLLADTDLRRKLPHLDEAGIRARASEAQKLILHDYSRFAVLTIDRFFQRLIRSFIRELGVEVNFKLELETDSLLALAADALVEDSADDESLRDRLFAATRDRLDDNKRWDIKESLLALGKELFGEEWKRAPENASTIIDAVVERADEVQKLYTKTAREMLQKIESYGLAVNDFKGKSKGLIPWLAKIVNGGGPMPLNNYVRDELEGKTLSSELKSLLSELDTLHNNNSRLVSSARLLRENRHNFLLLTDLQQRIERICAEENIMPISETNRMIARLIAGNDAPFIFEKAGNHYSRFFIDEFQDTSSSQWQNFAPLLSNTLAGEQGTPVMLIGDIKQAIYRWRGGDWQILSRRVYEEMGSGRVDEEALDTNYRSLHRVVEFNNEAIGRVAEAGNAVLNSMIADAHSAGSVDANEAAELTDMLARAYKGHAQKPKSDANDGYVTLTVYGADQAGDYLPPVVEKIEELQSRGYSAGDIAVIVRSNTQGARVAQMLLQRKHENPSSRYVYDVVTQEALTVGVSAASRFIIACLSLAADRGDVIQRAVYNRWLGRDFDEALNERDIAFFVRIAVLSPEEAFEEIVLGFGLNHRSADIAYIQAVHQQIIAFSSRSVADIPLFLEWWNEKGAAASITMQAGGAITVTTIHKAKGLQYKAVVVPYMSWKMAPDNRGKGLVVWAGSSEEGLGGAGAMPINYKEQMAGSFFSAKYYSEQVLAHIDSMNLLYVAVTRAEEELHLMCSSNPHDGKNSVGNVLRGALGITEDFTSWGSPVIRDRMPECEAVRKDAMSNGTLHTYPTSRPGARVRLRLPSSRYFEDLRGGGSENADAAANVDTAAAALSPRDFGVLMHSAFESAANADDVHRSLERMLADTRISKAEHTHLQDIIARAFANPLVADWFGTGWTEVRNEGDIVLPRKSVAGHEGSSNVASAIRRPDRVMTKDGRCVVVDYKFGRRTSPDHASQLREYMSLLRDMGYSPVEGYLWYVSLDSIERVDNN